MMRLLDRSPALRAAGAAALGLGAVALVAAVLSPLGAPAAGVRAQGPTLTEAYHLVDTWTGAGVGAPGSLLDPGGIDLAGGEVWVVDRGNGRVQAFTPDGAFVRAFGRHGDGAADFVAPRDIAAGNGKVYVTDPGKAAVLVFGADGTPAAQWTVMGLEAPYGVAVGGGRVAVSEPAKGEVLLFDEAGARTGGLTGLAQPRGVNLTPDGRLVVAQFGASVVTVHDTTGREIERQAVVRPPLEAVLDERGDLYVLAKDVIYWFESGKDASSAALYYDDLQALAVQSGFGVYATAARLSTQFHGIVRFPWRPRESAAATAWRLTGYPLGRLNRPSALTAADGQIWIADGWPRVQAFAPDGRAVQQYDLPQPAVDVGALSDGSLVVAELGRMHRLGPAGQLNATLQLGPSGKRWWVTGLTVQPNETRLTASDGAYAFARDVGLTSTLLPAGGFPMRQPGQPWQLYWDVASRQPSPGAPVQLYAVNRTAHTVEVFERGAKVREIAIDGVPTRIALDGAGRLYVLTTDGIVWKLAPDGTAVAAWDVGAFSASGVDVVDVTVDAEGRVYTLDRAAHTVRVWELDPGATAEPPQARGGACRVRGDKRAAPASLRLGTLVTVELVVGGDCPNTLPRADIVLAIDRSFSMTENNGITATRQAATAFLDAIDLSEDRVAVLAFNNTAQLVQPLTGDPTAARAAIAGLQPLGGTDIARAIEVAAGELFGPRRRLDAKPVIVLLTDGRPNNGPDETLNAAAAAKALGAQIFTIGFGEVDPMIMTLSASTPEDAYIAASTDTLMAIYTEIANRLTADVLAREVHITDDLPASVRFVAAVAGPSPVRNGQRLTWDLTDVPFGGIRLAYTVEPTTRGRQPTNVKAEATFIDGLARQGQLRFPVPEVNVLDLEPTVTPTYTPFPTATPRPTQTPVPVPIFLPVTLRQSCESADIGTDVVIVMDNSGSMTEPVRPGGPTRLQAAVAAAAVLVERMRAADRAAIVAFNREATLVQELTSDKALLAAELAGLQTATGTRVDLGLSVAYDELTGPRAIPANTRAVVLLTDGESEIEDEKVIEQAERVKPHVARLFVIGMGSPTELDYALLRGVATAPTDFFEAPDPDQLTAIYAQVARSITCANLDWPVRRVAP